MPASQIEGLPLVTVGTERFVLAFWEVVGNQPYRQHRIWLPAQTLQPERWLQLLLQKLQVDDPAKFPPAAAWTTQNAWAPPTLVAAHTAVEQLQIEHAAALARFEDRRLELESRVEQERADAEAGTWRLLTADGTELEDAVQMALEALGFTVEPRDQTDKGGSRLEDLRVTDPAQAGWTCLVEVKGYTRGASSNDVAKVAGRPSVVFTIENGREPDKLWHVVNPQRNTPPDQRNATFSDPDRALATFVASDGLVIDTRDLIRAVFAVESHAETAERVRASLATEVGLWSWPLKTP